MAVAARMAGFEETRSHRHNYCQWLAFSVLISATHNCMQRTAPVESAERSWLWCTSPLQPADHTLQTATIGHRH